MKYISSISFTSLLALPWANAQLAPAVSIEYDFLCCDNQVGENPNHFDLEALNEVDMCRFSYDLYRPSDIFHNFCACNTDVDRPTSSCLTCCQNAYENNNGRFCGGDKDDDLFDLGCLEKNMRQSDSCEDGCIETCRFNCHHEALVCFDACQVSAVTDDDFDISQCNAGCFEDHDVCQSDCNDARAR